MDLDPELKLSQPAPFVLSIEPCNGPVYQHGYHLGTDEKVARWFAAEMYRRVNDARGCYTTALIRNGQLVDTFDGRDWHSEIVDRAFEEENSGDN